jgi:hypothetical protein
MVIIEESSEIRGSARCTCWMSEWVELGSCAVWTSKVEVLEHCKSPRMYVKVSLLCIDVERIYKIVACACLWSCSCAR